jgi:hypothetical protein
MEMTMETTYEVWQDGLMVASVTGPRDGALRDALHYLFMYAQDGGKCVLKGLSEEDFNSLPSYYVTPETPPGP